MALNKTYRELFEEEREEARKKQHEFDQAVDKYLDQLTRVSTIEDLMRIIRDAATWARDAHRADRARKS